MRDEHEKHCALSTMPSQLCGGSDPVFRTEGEELVDEQALVATIVCSCHMDVLGNDLGVKTHLRCNLVDSFRHEGSFGIDEGNISL